MIDLEKVEKTIKIISKNLSIEDWKIIAHIATQAKIQEMMNNQAGEDVIIYHAAILVNYLKQEADIYVWDQLPENLLRITLFHECLHIIFYPIHSIFSKLISSCTDPENPDPLVQVIKDMFEDYEEIIINKLSKTLLDNKK